MKSSVNYVIVADHLRKHRDEYHGMLRSQAARLVKAQTGLVITGPTLMRIARQVGIELLTRPQMTRHKYSSTDIKIRCVAEAVAGLYQQLDEGIPQVLISIINGSKADANQAADSAQPKVQAAGRHA